MLAASFSDYACAQERESATAKPIARKPKFGPREVLAAMYGVDESHFANVTDGQPVEFDEEELLVKLLLAVGSIESVNIERWAKEHNDFQWLDLEGQPSKNRGKFFPLRGVVTKFDVRRPVPEQVKKIERFYRCECKVGKEQRPAVVYVHQVPEAWLAGEKIDKTVSFQGLFLKLASGGVDNPHTPVFVAKRLAWHPPTLIGKAGFDVSLFDGIAHHQKLKTLADKDGLYNLFGAMGAMAADKLENAAEAALRSLERDQEKSTGPAQFHVKHIFSQTRKTEQLCSDIKHLRLFRLYADETVILELKLKLNLVNAKLRPGVMHKLEENLGELRNGAKKWEISDKTLNNLGDLVTAIKALLDEKLLALHQHRQSPFAQGKPMVFEGTARRAIKVLVDEKEVQERFGIDHYYEMTVFVDLGGPFKLHKDSDRVFTSFPIHFCLARLPEGFPQGEQIHEHVRVAGVFFKVWPYSSEYSEAQGANKRHLAPLIVGREPVWIRPKSEKNSLYMMIASGLFVFALLSVVLVLRRTSRGDRTFRIKTIDRQYEAQPGVSLNDQNLDG